MTFQTVRLDDIDFSDETFRITEDLALEKMMASLKATGQINPVVLLTRTASPDVIVCGFRRLHALRQLGVREAMARMEQPSRAPLEIFSMALLDNVSHRVLNPLECARALSVLEHSCDVDQSTLVEKYLPLMGLAPHKNVLCSYLSLHRLEPALRRLLREEHLTVSSAERLAGKSSETQQEYARVLDRVRLSAAMQRKVLDLLEELGALAAAGLKEVVDRPEIASVLKGPGLSPFQRGEKVHDALRRLASPRLCRAHDQFRAKGRSLKLPGKVCLAPDPCFETPRIRVDFEVSSAAEFRDVASALHQAAQNPALDGLFQLD